MRFTNGAKLAAANRCPMRWRRDRACSLSPGCGNAGGTRPTAASCAASRSLPARPIRERMPVILPPQAWPLWLGETETMPDQLLALLQGCPEEWLRVYPVGPAVGNVRHDE